jgi:hypothetical protein
VDIGWQRLYPWFLQFVCKNYSWHVPNHPDTTIQVNCASIDSTVMPSSIESNFEFPLFGSELDQIICYVKWVQWFSTFSLGYCYYA